MGQTFHEDLFSCLAMIDFSTHKGLYGGCHHLSDSPKSPGGEKIDQNSRERETQRLMTTNDVISHEKFSTHVLGSQGY